MRWTGWSHLPLQRRSLCRRLTTEDRRRRRRRSATCRDSHRLGARRLPTPQTRRFRRPGTCHRGKRTAHTRRRKSFGNLRSLRSLRRAAPGLQSFPDEGVGWQSWWATGYNAVAIPLAAGIFYPLYQFLLLPAAGAVVMSLSTVIVAINAKLLKGSSER